MTRREAIQEQIARCRRIMYPAMVVSLTGIMATAISGFVVGEAISAFFALFTFMSFLAWVSAVLGISHTVRCPSCQKRLGYLLLDPSYSKKFAPIDMPKDIPKRITECPYCHVDFEEEITESGGRELTDQGQLQAPIP